MVPNPLEEIIIEKIKEQGRITFEEFMDTALYHPGLGYYASSENMIGREGDFYTSPHLHPAFGAMIGRQLMEMWMIMGRPRKFEAVEMGAGAGYLCKDVLEYLNRTSGEPSFVREKTEFSDSLRYIIVEPFLHVEKKQRELLGDNDVTWVKSLNELSGISGCIFSNELLDAFPVHLVETGDALKEIYVSFDGEKFVEERGRVSLEDIDNYIRMFTSGTLPPGYRTEVNLRIRDWLRDACAALSEGFLLTVDYGYSSGEYYSEDRTSGTLLCYHGHRVNENPYRNVGRQDITAHVNFSSLKKWGDESGLKTIGYCPQGTFLAAAGIDEVITELYTGSSSYLREVAKIKGLIMPQGMGESHNVMIQYKGKDSPELRGFSIRNQKSNL